MDETLKIAAGGQRFTLHYLGDDWWSVYLYGSPSELGTVKTEREDVVAQTPLRGHVHIERFAGIESALSFLHGVHTGQELAALNARYSAKRKGAKA